jgi:hypothetical protein
MIITYIRAVVYGVAHNNDKDHVNGVQLGASE